MARSSSPDTLLDRLEALAARPLGRWMLRILGVAALLLVGGLVVRQARARVWNLPGYRLGPRSVVFKGLPASIRPLVLPALADPHRIPFDASVFDDDAADTIRAAIARHPMIAAVESVDIRFPNRIDVRARVREPVAWFEVHLRDGREGWVLVSGDARTLDPRDYREIRRCLRTPLPRVRGVRALPTALFGQAWEDHDEQVAEGVAAARVAARLYRDFNGTLVVQTIDVSRFPAAPERRRDGELRFVLQDGTVVEWGRTDRDRDGVASEDPYETKEWRLETELARRGRSRGGRIDVRFRLPGEGRLQVP